MADKQSPQGESTRTGTQSIERVVGMLRVVASRGRRGMRIGEIAATSGLPQSTCARMLARLEIEGLVDRDVATRKYFLGPLLHELGLLARPRYRLSDLCDGALHRLADVTQDTLYLSERSGMEAVCTNRALGDFPIKAMPLDIGIRRPLGVGAGGLALMASLPDEDISALYARHAASYAQIGVSSSALMKAVKQTRAIGHAEIVDTITPGVSGVGVAFPVSELTWVAFSFGAISSRLDAPRRAEMGALLHAECLAWARDYLGDA